MIEQNTHRLWMTVGSIIVGAVLIFGFKDEVGQVLGATLSKFGIEIDSSFSDKDDPEVVAGMFDYDKDSKMIVGFASDYEHKDSTLVIPEEYEGLPSTLKYIGETSFLGMSNTKLVIPDSVEYIGDQAFNFGATKMSNLTELVLGKNVKHIGTSAFKWAAIVQFSILKF